MKSKVALPEQLRHNLGLIAGALGKNDPLKFSLQNLLTKNEITAKDITTFTRTYEQNFAAMRPPERLHRLGATLFRFKAAMDPVMFALAIKENLYALNNFLSYGYRSEELVDLQEDALKAMSNNPVNNRAKILGSTHLKISQDGDVVEWTGPLAERDRLTTDAVMEFSRGLRLADGTIDDLIKLEEQNDEVNWEIFTRIVKHTKGDLNHLRFLLNQGSQENMAIAVQSMRKNVSFRGDPLNTMLQNVTQRDWSWSINDMNQPTFHAKFTSYGFEVFTNDGPKHVYPSPKDKKQLNAGDPSDPTTELAMELAQQETRELGPNEVLTVEFQYRVLFDAQGRPEISVDQFEISSTYSEVKINQPGQITNQSLLDEVDAKAKLEKALPSEHELESDTESSYEITPRNQKF